VDVDEVHAAAAAKGLDYGAAFRGMRRLRCGPGEALAEVRLPEEVNGAESYGIHPALLDAAVHASLGLGEGREARGPWLPFSIGRLTVHEAGSSTATVCVRVTDVVGEAATIDVTLTDAQGHVLVEVEGLQARAAADTLGHVEQDAARVQASRRRVRAKRSRWAEELLGLSPREREEVVLKTVRAEVGRVLSMGSAEAVMKDRPLRELGLDSRMAVELRTVLGKRAGKTLLATLAFDYPTPAAIATYLVERVLGFSDDARVAGTVDPSDVGLGIETVRRLSDEEAVLRVQRELRAAFGET
jgi:acyl carrier protein